MRLTEMSGYVEYFKDSKCMKFFFFFEDKEILQNFNNILDKVKNYLRKNLIVNLCIVINILKLK